MSRGSLIWRPQSELKGNVTNLSCYTVYWAKAGTSFGENAWYSTYALVIAVYELQYIMIKNPGGCFVMQLEQLQKPFADSNVMTLML